MSELAEQPCTIAATGALDRKALALGEQLSGVLSDTQGALSAHLRAGRG